MIKPLLEIKNIPMSMEYKINKAHYEIVNTNVPVEITQNDNIYEMRLKPVKLNIDTVEVKHSVGNNNAILAVENFAKQGKDAAYEVSSSFAGNGNFMLNIKIFDNTAASASDIAFKKFQSDVSMNISSWEPQEIFIKYDIDKLNFDLNGSTSQIKFVPGNIELIIKEYPRVEIKYLGEPLYVPPSANPNYEPVDILV